MSITATTRIRSTVYRVMAATALSAALITGAGSIASAATTTVDPLTACYVSIDGAPTVKIYVSQADCVTLHNASSTAASQHRAAEHRAVNRGRQQARAWQMRTAPGAAKAVTR